jgi:hypothetical protein
LFSKISSVLGCLGFFVTSIAIVFSGHPYLQSFVAIILFLGTLGLVIGLTISIFVYEKDVKGNISYISTFLTNSLKKRVKEIDDRSKEICANKEELEKQAKKGISDELIKRSVQLDEENKLLGITLKEIKKAQRKIRIYRIIKPKSLYRVANVFFQAAILKEFGTHYRNFDVSLWCYSTKVPKWRAKVYSNLFPKELQGMRFDKEQWTGTSFVNKGNDENAPNQFFYYDATSYSDLSDKLKVNRVEAEAIKSDFKRLFLIRPSSYQIPGVVASSLNSHIELMLVVRSRLDQQSQIAIFGPQEDADTDRSTLDDSFVYLLAIAQMVNSFLFTFIEN